MAVATDRIARQVAFALEIKSPKIFENIFLNNGVLVLLGAKGRVRIKRGGNRFDERVHLGENPNTDHRSRFAEIDTNFSDTWRTAEYGQAVLSGAAPINMVERDQAQGPEKLSDLTDETLGELMNTFPNKVADALMAASSGANDPLSLLEELPATAAGSQTETTGGIVRSDFNDTSDRTRLWQTQYSNQSADLSAAAGIASATKFGYTCSEGSALDMQPDIMLTTDGIFSQASGNADVLRRFGVNDTLLKFRFDNIKIGNAALVGDRNMPTNNAFFLNTNYLRVQVLASDKMKASKSVKVVGDGAVSVPLNVSAPIESDNFLNWTIKAWLTYNLTFGALKYHGRMDNLTEAS